MNKREKCDHANIMYNEFQTALNRVKKTYRHAKQRKVNKKIKLLQLLVEVKEKRKRKKEDRIRLLIKD